MVAKSLVNVSYNHKVPVKVLYATALSVVIPKDRAIAEFLSLNSDYSYVPIDQSCPVVQNIDIVNSCVTPDLKDCNDSCKEQQSEHSDPYDTDTDEPQDGNTCKQFKLKRQRILHKSSKSESSLDQITRSIRKPKLKSPVHITQLKLAHIRAPDPQNYLVQVRQQNPVSTSSDSYSESSQHEINTGQNIQLQNDNPAPLRRTSRVVKKPIRYRDENFLSEISSCDGAQEKIKRILAKKPHGSTFLYLVQ
ncbi:unnamed protein product [Mytilus coruscus]|uniref:Uncharacterized protein n=1 Tax=Mytilus coruscus TaxID=42192 RepID=A0A6J8A6M4_MYTCO|nr:unnamed protein product [Mytilus coruscus]